MDKTKIIKVVVAVVIGILAILYYFSTKQDATSYENLLSNDVIVENKTEESEEKKASIKVYVTGEVNAPGVIELEEGARIEDAIEGAGGIKPEANLKNINLAYEVSDGEKIYIPNLAEVSEEETDQNPTENNAGASSSSNSKGKVNINKATEAELTSVPGIGASTAQKIISYREENGKFKSVEDIKNVKGIGDSKYESMKDSICVK